MESGRKVGDAESLWNPLRYCFLFCPLVCILQVSSLMDPTPPSTRQESLSQSFCALGILSLTHGPCPLPQSQILAEPPSGLHIRHQSEVGGGGKGAHGRHTFSSHRSGWSSREDFQGHAKALSRHRRSCCFCKKQLPPQPWLLCGAASVRVSATKMGARALPCFPHLTKLQIKVFCRYI